jgi:hypothetical protein
MLDPRDDDADFMFLLGALVCVAAVALILSYACVVANT